MYRSTIYLSIATCLAALPAQAANDKLEELVISARHDTRTIDITNEMVISPDVTQLLKKAPGANVNYPRLIGAQGTFLLLSVMSVTAVYQFVTST